ncbi:hypothetical protein, partial [Variovorax atrisoli]|uniref:hypothetical protein n=1 Tax=Variovorax atrisoli TaxID=3394203 RepID=UPI0040400C19
MSTTTLSTRRAASAPHRPAPLQAGWHRALVRELSPQAVSLCVGERQVQARQAFSCLVALQEGDSVAAPG